LLLVLGLASAHVQRLPISTSIVYLSLGIALGPQGLGWLQLSFEPGNAWFERLTEVAVIVALFLSGMKLRLPLRHKAWAASLRLAGPVMLICIGGVALFAHLALGLAPAYAVLLGAVLAPTDPVLASAVAVNDAADKDRLRYGLSGEAGLNDGTAFPFVVLALAWAEHGRLGSWLLKWFTFDVLWAVPAALALGFFMGQRLGGWAIGMRSRHRDTEAPGDFIAMSLIALPYAAAELIHAWGFLAVFAAGVGFRKAELTVLAASPHPQTLQEPHVSHPPVEHLVAVRVNQSELAEPAVAAGVLFAETISFGGTAERLFEVILITLVGAAVGHYFDVRALWICVVLFVVVRPLATRLLLMGTATTSRQRWLLGWFGIRGIGSLYYLAYALNHGLGGAHAKTILTLTIPVIAVSILVHGTSATPLLDRYRAARES
jgi:NhaP-type Na+/H+ or K+/H+ antiporter